MSGTVGRAVPGRLSERARAAAGARQEAAPHPAVLDDLVAGRLPRPVYAQLTAQYFFIHEALESAAVAMAADPVAGVFVFPELSRLPAIIEDLTVLCGPDWADAIAALPATAAYCARLREVAFDRPPAFLAHHYVRYLGERFGADEGRALAQAYGLRDRGDRSADGASERFGQRYRAQLDALSWPPEQADEFLAEVALAYALDDAVLHQLAQRLW